MTIFKRPTCAADVDHRSVAVAANRVKAMSTPDLFDWSRNCAIDMAAMIDRVRENPGVEDMVDDLRLCSAMVHACVAEISKRVTS